MDDDIRRAVLFGLQTASRAQAPVTSAVLFKFLPKSLRERWSPDYVARYVLPDLYDADLIGVTLEEQRVMYCVTPSGRLFLQS